MPARREIAYASPMRAACFSRCPCAPASSAESLAMIPRPVRSSSAAKIDAASRKSAVAFANWPIFKWIIPVRCNDQARSKRFVPVRCTASASLAAASARSKTLGLISPRRPS